LVDDVRILHLADPHWDFSPRPAERRIRALIEAGGFDAVACTGDIANRRADVAAFLSWFSDLAVPRYLSPGNHDLWAFPDPGDLQAEAERHGWHTVDPERDYEVVDGVLLLNLFYTPQPAWDAWGGNDVAYTNDHRHFDVAARMRPTVAIPDDPPAVDWSLGHMAPSGELAGGDKPHSLYVNPLQMDVIRAHRSPLHLFGHTHHPGETVVEGVRCVNSSFVDRRYRIRGDAGCLVTL
jgi:predicted phosphodiesterase